METREEGACPARCSHPFLASSLTFTRPSPPSTCTDGIAGFMHVGQQPEHVPAPAAHRLPDPVLHAALVFPPVTYSPLWARLGCARPLPLAVYSPAQGARGWASAAGLPIYCPQCSGCGSNRGCWGVVLCSGDIWEPFPCPAIHGSHSRARALFLTRGKNIQLSGFSFIGHAL